MKAICITLFLLLIAVSVQSQSLPYKYKVLEKMTLANKYFMDKWPDPTAAIVTDKSRPSNLWTRGTYYEGLMALYYINRDISFYKYAVDWGTFFSWGPTYGGSTTRIADNQCCGQTYIELYLLDQKPERIQTIQSCIDGMVNSTIIKDWWWVDALHMAMPVFAKFGVLYSADKYYEKMFDLYNYTKTKAKGIGLYNTTDHLWYRDSVYLPPKTTSNGKPVYWSRGNGWVFAALTRTLDVLPLSAPHRSEYVTTFQEMAAKLITIQRTDGFWNPSLADPNDYGGKETSGTAFFTYGLAWGINNGLLDSATYYQAVFKGWKGMVDSALHTNGMLGYVQGSGSKPADGQPLYYNKAANFEDFGLGGFLLVGSQVYKLAHDSVTVLTDVSKIEKGSENFNLKVFPNPFSNSISISFTIENYNKIDISVFDAGGRKVNTLIGNSVKKPGKYVITWYGTGYKGEPLPSGIYFICLKDGSNKKQVKVELVK
jgi:unsaturated rhamnogalacturonyl hydrolase